MNTKQRKQEAERIAKIEGVGIEYHDEDWTFFSLADKHLNGLAGRFVQTHFVWESFRFEGFVS